MWQMTGNKSYKIQILRGLAILAVVLIHNTPIGIAQVWCRPFINFSVGMFLFLSGLLSSMEKWNLKKRILKITIPYIIWTLIYVILGNIKTPENIPWLYFKNLITADSAAVMYFVFVYCEVTFLIPVIDKVARSRYRWVGFVLSPLEIIIMRMIPVITGLEVNRYISLVMHISCLGWLIYYYFGYLLGNGYLKVTVSFSTIFWMWIVAIALQIAEGYWYYSMGELNCGTQLKLSAVLAGLLFVMLGYRYLEVDNVPMPKVLHLLGDYSFGIFFSHLAIMRVLGHFSSYKQVGYPLNAIIVIALSLLVVMAGRKILGKYAKYLAF